MATIATAPQQTSKLKAHRLAAGFSQWDLAVRAGITAGTIHSLERGHRKRPHMRTARAIAQALDVPATDLFGPNE